MVQARPRVSVRRFRRPVLIAAAILVAGTLVLAVVLATRTKGGPGPTSLPTRSESPTAVQPPAAASTAVARVPGLPPGAVLEPAADPAGGARPAPLEPAVGFARDTTGGSNGATYHVTSRDDTPASPQPGTLRYGLMQRKALWIVFDADMTITFGGAMTISPDKTIDGRGRHVTLTGHGQPGLHLYDTHNVIIENVSFHDFGDTAKTGQNDPDDAIDIQRAQDIWIDHCSMSMVGDKLIAMEDGPRQVTISWNHFYDQEQTLQIGALSTAARDIGTTVTVHHNFFDRTGYRDPLVAYAKAHIYNNYIFEWKTSAVRSERVAQMYLEANVLQAGTNRKGAILTPAQRCNDSHKYCDGRSGFLNSVGNVVLGGAVIRSSGPNNVFLPSAAYDYRPDQAGPTLAADVRAHAGMQ
ncbi:MAG: hypothetical protein DLM57_18475 [Pseudonocardiales bacterium]|nr:MAG: hypothetical protein DLM57_18475 [Pseudonocardiales bacterium]